MDQSDSANGGSASVERDTPTAHDDGTIRAAGIRRRPRPAGDDAAMPQVPAALELVEQSTDESDRWRAVLRVPMTGGSAAGPRLPQDAVEIELQRQVGPSMHEVIVLRNWSAGGFKGRVALELDADFADISRS